MAFVKRFFIAVIALAYVAVLALCCISGPVAADGKTGSAYFGTARISFYADTYPVDAQELSMPLQSGETALLSNFTQLKKADFSGSADLEEIYSWAQANPQVEVTYTVPLPNGQTVTNHVTELDFSGIDSDTLTAVSAYMRYLPNVQKIRLGQAADEASALSAAALSSISSACPQAKLDYSFFLHGQALTLEAESVDLSGIVSDEVDTAAIILSCLKNIKTVELGTAGTNGTLISWDELGKLVEACPQAEFFYNFTLYGKEANLQSESLDFSYQTIEDKGADLCAALPYMNKCSFVNMDTCGIGNEDMAAIRDQFPDKKIVWRIWFGNIYTVRTDAIKILASKPSVGGVLGNEINDVLKYCTDMKYIDLGHNENISDISFVNYMPDLEVLVIAMNPLEDISPLANCPKIEYLELNSTHVSDLSPLANAKSLRHLNIGNCTNVTDISPICNLTELERFWIGCDVPVSEEQVAAFTAAVPKCQIDTTTNDPTQGGWRFTDLNDEGWRTWALYRYFTFENHPRYELLREQFGYATLDYSFYYNDPTYLGPDP